MAARILLVDDELAVLKAWTKALRHAGHHVTCASSPDAALVAADEHIFDVIIVDYVMPAMTGVELLARIRKKQPLARAIVVSGRIEGTLTEDEIRSTIQEAVEADFYLHKPVSNDRLREAVSAITAEAHTLGWEEMAKRVIASKGVKLKATKAVERKIKPKLKKR
ncbi:MAG TPA: response regulator [Bryobacteraceae bacterium]|nr:response regulator [Bryobacteraceae bacterium]